jgi:hypothetical protein
MSQAKPAMNQVVEQLNQALRGMWRVYCGIQGA